MGAAGKLTGSGAAVAAGAAGLSSGAGRGWERGWGGDDGGGGEGAGAVVAPSRDTSPPSPDQDRPPRPPGISTFHRVLPGFRQRHSRAAPSDIARVERDSETRAASRDLSEAMR